MDELTKVVLMCVSVLHEVHGVHLPCSKQHYAPFRDLGLGKVHVASEADKKDSNGVPFADLDGFETNDLEVLRLSILHTRVHLIKLLQILSACPHNKEWSWLDRNDDLMRLCLEPAK